MQVRTTSFPDVFIFVPTAHYDERGFFTRTFDTTVATEYGVNSSAFIQDSQSRSHKGVLRGMHGRIGQGEAKLVRCARGTIHDVLVDIRPESPAFGRSEAFCLDDRQFWHLYIPPGFLHGFQVLSDIADVCYRIDRPHDATEDISVRYDDPDLDLTWPLPISRVSKRDADAGSWSQLKGRLM